MGTWFRTKKTKGLGSSYTSTTERNDGKRSRSTSHVSGNTRYTRTEKTGGLTYVTETTKGPNGFIKKTKKTIFNPKKKIPKPKIPKTKQYKPKKIKITKMKPIRKTKKQTMSFKMIIIIFTILMVYAYYVPK